MQQLPAEKAFLLAKVRLNAVGSQRAAADERHSEQSYGRTAVPKRGPSPMRK